MKDSERIAIANVTTIDADGNVAAGRRVILERDTIVHVGPETGAEPGKSAEPSDLGKGAATTGTGGAGGGPGASDAGDGGPTVDVVDGTGRFLTPSLVNMHAHTPMNIFKGIAEDVTVEDWFNREIWPYESKMEAADVAIGTDLAIAESIQAGVTAVADHYFMATVVCERFLSAGLRLDMAPTLFGVAGDYESQLDQAAEVVQEWDGREGRIRVRFGPHAPYTCDPEQLKATAERARKLGRGVHIHMAESAEQVEASIRDYGKSPLAVVFDAGLLEVPTILAHGVFLTEADRELLNGAGGNGGAGRDSIYKTTMALCPKTYQKLGTGMGHPLNDIGSWPVTIGTDGAGSSNTLNPVEQARLLGLWAKERTGTGEALPAPELWRILMRGHRALDFGSGRLQAGAPADLILWDLDDPATQPVYDPVSAILYSSHPGNVSDVWVAGRRVKRDRAVQMDLEALFSEARQRVTSLLRRGKGRTKLLY